MPVQNAESHKGADEKNQLSDPPKRFPLVLPHQRLENGLGIFAKETEKRVSQRMFRLAVVPVFVDRNPVDRLALFVRPVAFPL